MSDPQERGFPDTTLSARARRMAALIDSLPGEIRKSFSQGRSVRERLAILSRVTGEIDIGMFPIVEWGERRESPQAVDLLKRRLFFVLEEAIACVRYDIPEYVTGTPQKVSGEPSQGAGRTATLVVPTKFLAVSLQAWANDIEADEKQRDDNAQAGDRVTPIPEWKPKPGYVGAKTICGGEPYTKKGKPVPRTTLQDWQEADSPVVDRDPASGELHYPGEWVAKHFATWSPRTVTRNRKP